MLLSCQPGGRQGMRQLTGWITAKEADAGCLTRHSLCKLGGGPGLMRVRVFAIVPVLAKQTVEGAGTIENCQIGVTLFRPGQIGPLGVASTTATSTYPISYTVRGERIAVPGNCSLIKSPTS